MTKKKKTYEQLAETIAYELDNNWMLDRYEGKDADARLEKAQKIILKVLGDKKHE